MIGWSKDAKKTAANRLHIQENEHGEGRCGAGADAIPRPPGTSHSITKTATTTAMVMGVPTFHKLLATSSQSTALVDNSDDMPDLDDSAESEADAPNAVIDLVSATTSLHRQQELPFGSSPAQHPDDASLFSISSLPKEIRNLLAGGVAGMVAKSIVAPMDRIKILYQVSSTSFQLRDLPNVVRTIVAEEGVSALWKGNVATMIRVFPYSGIQFMVFDRCKTFLLQEHAKQHQHELKQKEQQHGGNQDDSGKQQQQHAALTTRSTNLHKFGLSPLESLGAGMLAGVTSVVVTYPLDLTRAQLAVLRRKRGLDSAHQNAGFVEVLSGNYRQRGIAGLFRGISPTLMGILPYSGVAFALNEQAKRRMQRITKRELTTIERMQCGALSGLFAQSLTYPLEVTRRRMQTIGVVPTKGNEAAVDMLSSKAADATASTKNAAAASNVSSLRSPPTMMLLVTELYREQGIRGFFKGVTMNWFKGPIAISISFTAFDVLQRLLESPEESAIRLKQHQPH